MRLHRPLLSCLLLVAALASQAGAAPVGRGGTPTPYAAAVSGAQRFQPSVRATAGYDGTAESSFLHLLNAHRAHLGVAPLRSDAGLTAYARAHAQYQASVNQLHHSNISVLLGPFSIVGENVGIGPNITAIHHAFVASAEHHRNLADPIFTHAGIGVFVDGAGVVWTAHLFGRA